MNELTVLPREEPSAPPPKQAWDTKCTVVGGACDGDRVLADIRRPFLELRKREPLPPWEQLRAYSIGEPTYATEQHHYVRLELRAGMDDHSVFIYHDPEMRPWEVLEALAKRYRG